MQVVPKRNKKKKQFSSLSQVLYNSGVGQFLFRQGGDQSVWWELNQQSHAQLHLSSLS